jgi:hypothetical protein
MEKLLIRILDKKAVKKLQTLADKKLIEITETPATAPVDWASFIGVLPKMSFSEIEKEIASFRNWG